MQSAIITKLSQIPSTVWNALYRDENPFLCHEFLSGLEQTGCVGPDTGWEPHHFVVYADHEQTDLVGAAPAYLKHHSWGEYIFDWAWADAYQRAGLRYYPKLLCAVPFTPVTAPKLLVRDRDESSTPAALEIRRELAKTMLKTARDSSLSSAHMLFTTPEDNAIFAEQGMLQRSGNQFHWTNPGYDDFEHFLKQLSAQKRKKIRRERRRVVESDIRVEILTADALQPRHWDAMYRFYQMTVALHGAIPYLNREFFEYLHTTLARNVVLMLAADGGRYVAGGLYLCGGDVLYGRYWGAQGFYDSLHFEICYYQPIEYCIVNRLRRFEAGAQGEHKLSRGLLPQTTYSAHWLRDQRFADAVADFLQRETVHVDQYSRALNDHTPFRREV